MIREFSKEKKEQELRSYKKEKKKNQKILRKKT